MKRDATPPKGRPDRILSYFQSQKGVLLAVTVFGLIYNIGLLAGPWFEGQLAQCLMEILEGHSTFQAMLRLVLLYGAVIAVVQTARFLKRLYVRRFANQVNRRMKHVLYGNLVHKSKEELESEGAGNLMTKAISDVDACAEGMRKFTTELFDTGVALLAYVGLLLWYDWRLALLCLIFPPFSYLLAEKMKTVVLRTGAACKESAGRLNAATLDRVAGAITYRVFGCEQERDQAYEDRLADYEASAVRANFWVSAMPPLYQVLSMASVLFILSFGASNVAGTGWRAWDIAAFTAFLSCYTKLAVKSSKAAKLFNAVQQAEVSWKRIKPLMRPVPQDPSIPPFVPAELTLTGLTFAYPGGEPLFPPLSCTAAPGQIIGVTGPVACGKSTLGRAFLCDSPYLGSIRLNGQELWELPPEVRRGLVGYLGHDPELMSDTIQANLCLGSNVDPWFYLRAVCLDQEVAALPDGIQTRIGSGGVRLSGGQQARLALARTLAHKRSLLVLDDPFAALDRETELQVFANLRKLTADCVVVLISHRLYLFPQTDRVIWLHGGQTAVSTHSSLVESDPDYRALYHAQQKGGISHEEAQ